MKPIIVVEGVSKQFRLGEKVRSRTFRETIQDTAALPLKGLRRLIDSRDGESDEDSTVWALRDVNFEIRPGEVVGLIGKNGAGKSTLLKVLSRITEPTTGRVELYGRVGSLLEVGTGFHPELSGRENIYLNGAVLGMKRREIQQKFDEIVAFAEVEKFVDTPVKRYSSGMYLRLAFAVAAHLEPEILLVDEVLAVGDAAFQQKCIGKMGSVANEGRTVLFVSHNMSAVATLCPSTMWLNGGTVAFRGETGDAISYYYESTRTTGSVNLLERRDRSGSGLVRLTQFALQDREGKTAVTARSGDPVRFVIGYECDRPLGDAEVVMNLVFLNERGQRLFSVPSNITGDQLSPDGTSGRFICSLPELPLLPGVYDVHISCTVDKELADKLLFGAHMTVVEGDFFGTQQLPHSTLGDMLVRFGWQEEPDEADRAALAG